MNEFSLIKKYFAPLSAKENGAFNLTDDAAVLNVPKGMELVVTKDAIVEGVHFIGDESPALIAGKLLGTNLSDLAAMGATPYGYFLALMLPENTNEEWIKSFAQGLRTYQKAEGITLMGGDTTHTKGPLCLSLTAMGFVPKGIALKRSGAKVGDDVYVSGTIGDAALGLILAKKLRGNAEEFFTTTPLEGVSVSEGGDLYSPPYNVKYLLKRYQLPTPRIALGQALGGIATACIDISDGLLQDLGHIAECSGVGAVIAWDKIPLSTHGKKMLPILQNPHQTIAAGGDDYELLFTASPKMRRKLHSATHKAGIKITRIGTIIAGKQVKMIDKDGRNINVARKGYQHFR